MSASSSSSGSLPIRMDPFCLKQFQPAPSNGGQHIAIPCKPDEFVHKTNEYFSEVGSSGLKDGYAPFCKHLFIPASRFPFQVACAYAPITEENKHKLESVYSARTDKELPVLTRFFAKGSVEAAPATFLDVILYSREQIEKENAAMKNKASLSSKPAEEQQVQLPAELSSQGGSAAWDWGIVSVKPQTVSHETPMNPITVMRNSLGKDEGGSGVPLNRAAYMESVEFWSKHAIVQ